MCPEAMENTKEADVPRLLPLPFGLLSAAGGKAANPTTLPRYFGLGKGLTFYTWTWDQYSQYGPKVISATLGGLGSQRLYRLLRGDSFFGTTSS